MAGLSYFSIYLQNMAFILTLKMAFTLKLGSRCSDKEEISTLAVKFVVFYVTNTTANSKLSRKFTLYRKNILKCLKSVFVRYFSKSEQTE